MEGGIVDSSVRAQLIELTPIANMSQSQGSRTPLSSGSDSQSQQPPRQKKLRQKPRVNSETNITGQSPLRLVDNEHRQDMNDTNPHNEESMNDMDDVEFKYGAKHVIRIFIPVSICMLVVVATMNSIKFYQSTNVYLVYAPFTDQNVDNTTKLWQSFANAFIILLVVIVMTTFVILLYKFRFYKTIHGWMMMTSLTMFSMFMMTYLTEVLKVYNIPMDYFTFFFAIYNIGVVGMICIHWKGPLRLQQTYHIIVAALMALTFIKFLPDWTTWTVLGVLSVWDLVAVLAPNGPLRIMVELAEERNEPIFPSLIYSAMAYMAVPEDPSAPMTQQDVNNPPEVQIVQPQREVSRQNSSQRLQQQQPNEEPQRFPIQEQPSQRDSADEGIKLGLGDFIFYSVLVGKASSYGDWNTTLACFVAILVGLSLTLLLLAIFRAALPALPISITFGLIFYFSTSTLVVPFSSLLHDDLIYI